MIKYIVCIILWAFIPKIAMAVDLELNDKIKEAREAQMKIAKSQIKQNVAQTKQQFSTNTPVKGEQNAVEKLNPNEILKQGQVK